MIMAGLIAGAWLTAAHPAAGQQGQRIETERPPRLLNAEAAESAITAVYPPDLLARGVAGEASVGFTIRPDGSVDTASVAASWATDSALVEPAQAVARRLRFTPPVERGSRVSAPHQLRIRFFPTRAAADSAGYASDVSAADLHPRLLNSATIIPQLSERYPPALMARRVAGAVLLRFRIRTDGLVDSASISAVRSSDTAFVQPALAIGRQLAFTPTVLGGRPAEFWYTFNLRFLPTEGAGARDDRAPRLTNGAEVDRRTAAGHPADLRANHVSGAVSLWFRIRANGRVDAASVVPLEWTHEAFVEPAAHVARRMVFAPAMVRGRPLDYWHSYILRFTVPGVAERRRLIYEPSGVQRSTPPGEGTYEMAAVEVLPALRDRARVVRQIQAGFAAALADSGGAGQVTLRVRVMQDGGVDPATVEVEATNPAVVQAATEIARRLRFSPGMVNNRPVPVWVTLPFSYDVPVPVRAGEAPTPAGSTTP
jgi:TonB family protein